MKANPTLALTVASLKMWLRDRQALFWTLFLPLLIMVILGLMNFGAFGNVDLGLVDQADNQASRRFVENLEAIEALNISHGVSLEEERQALKDGDRHMVLILPPSFQASGQPTELQILFNEGRPQEVQVGQTIIRQALDEITFSLSNTPRLFTLNAQSVDSRNLRYVDFLMPGIVAMAIMQMGLFSVAFGFVQLKQRGILRRLLATPVQPRSFLFAQVTTRLIVSLLQTGVLIAVGVIFFDVQFVGNLGAIFLLAILGGAVFVSMGFAISGWAKNEQVAAPIANIVAMPMMFLSGVFFPRDVMPAAAQSVTAYLPLTYLGDSLRSIAIDGVNLWAVRLDLVGMVVWLIISFVVATRLFRWE